MSQSGEKVEDAPEFYAKAGQKHATPSPGEGSRVFYESLYKEKGDSCSMALIWCIEHGLFSKAQALEKAEVYLAAKEAIKSRTVTESGHIIGTESHKSKPAKIVSDTAFSSADIGMSVSTEDRAGVIGM